MSDTASRGLNAAYWLGLAIGRLLAVPLTSRLSPSAMLSADFAGIVLTSAALLALCSAVPGATVGSTAFAPIMWTLTIAFGLSMASIFPSVITHAGACIVNASDGF